jgi:hypothetical protein
MSNGRGGGYIILFIIRSFRCPNRSLERFQPTPQALEIAGENHGA